jgi:hypothetical protein
MSYSDGKLLFSLFKEREERAFITWKYHYEGLLWDSYRRLDNRHRFLSGVGLSITFEDFCRFTFQNTEVKVDKFGHAARPLD